MEPKISATKNPPRQPFIQIDQTKRLPDGGQSVIPEQRLDAVNRPNGTPVRWCLFALFSPGFQLSGGPEQGYPSPQQFKAGIFQCGEFFGHLRTGVGRVVDACGA